MHKNPNLNNIYVRSEDYLGLCETQANFIHKQVVIQIDIATWKLFKHVRI